MIGESYSGTKDFRHEVAMGRIPNVTQIDKFGQNPSIANSGTAEDIWDEGGTYEFITELAGGSQASGAQLTLSSTDAVDDVGNTGATSVEIFGLDANYAKQNETIAMDGQAAVTTTGTYTRIHRAIVRAAGSGEINAGIIRAGTGAVVAGVPANVYARISIGKGQTLMAIYTTAANCKSSFIDVWASVNRNVASTEADIELLMRPDGEVFQIKKTVGLNTTGSSEFSHAHNHFGFIAEKTDIKVRATGGDNNIDVSAGFALFEEDQS